MAPSLRVPFHQASITEDDIAAVVEVMRSGWLTTGPEVAAFEAEFAAYVGAKHTVALNSGTAALHLALEALGVGPGDEVIVPAYTFTATGEVVRYLGARPVLADVDPRSLNLTAEEIERRRTPRTRAVMPVHIAGVACDMAAISEVSKRLGLHVVEDAAHALPTRTALGAAGTVGDAGSYSFYATKTITTGEGGMLATERDDVAARARQMALHGISRIAYDRYRVPGRWYYEVEDFGFKYNLTDMAAALGRSQLRRADALWTERRSIAARYDTAFSDLASIQVPFRVGGDADSWHLYLIRLHLDRLACDRDRFIQDLTDRGIGTSVHFIPLHLHPVYRRVLGYAPGDLPVAEAEYRRLISLPIWPGMGDAAIDAVVDAVRDVAERHAR